MNLAIADKEFSQAVFEFTGINANITLNDKIYIRFVKVIPIYVVLVPKVNQNLEFEIDCVKVGGINITGIARNKIFTSISKCNNDKFWLTQQNRSILLNVKCVEFTEVSLKDCVLFLGFKTKNN